MKKILFYTICLLLCNGAFAQGGNESAGRKVYSLQDCLMEGLENNYSIKIQKNKQSVSDNNATIGNAGFLPSLSASAMYSGNAQDTETKLRDTREIVEENGIFNQTIDAGLNLNWTIFEGFNVISTYRKLQELKSQGELNTRIALENLIADITAEYYNYIQQMIRLKNLRYAMELSKERLRIVEQRYNLGNFSGLDYQQARVDFNSDSSSFMKQQETLKSSAIALNELLAMEDLNNPIAVADTAITVEKFMDFNDIMESMMSNNATLLYAKSQSSVSELEYRITASQSYPYLRLNAGYGYTRNKYNRGTNYYRGTLGADFGLTLGINIFDGNNVRRLRRNAKLNIENAHLGQTETEQGLKADLYNIWHAYANNLQILELEKENLVTAKLNHEIAMERYMLGDLSGIEMREAQKSLLDAEERLLSSQYNTKLCEISLLQISGKIKQYLQ
ncbi:MAG: TolC family protein [Bacteroidales bacterium]|nr:TolC family protein [Bacteroidales bacterium]MBO7269158.1 TolC family protein [Bacteroidales bacterium]